MKKGKSPENTEITPSKKKLKQARLPFKILSDVSPTPVTPATRKRKLSAPNPESATKIGKISNENDLVEDLVVISDEDSKDTSNITKPEKTLNPYVKIVDMARKKRLRKTSGKKKKANKNKKAHGSLENGTDSANDTGDDKEDDCELMDVDEPKDEKSDNSDIKSGQMTLNETEITNTSETHLDTNIIQDTNEIVVLDESNNSCDIKSDSNTLPNKSKVNSPVSDLNSVSENGTEPELNADDSSSKESSEPVTSGTQTKIENKSDKSDLKDVAVSPVTPKRSMRNRNKPDTSNGNETTPTSMKLNKSVTSNPSTPTNKSLSATNSLDDSITDTTAKNLTPKQLAKRLESAKKKEEREKERIEREKKKQQEKEDRAKQRQEKEDQKKKEREEKEEQKKKEKEEKERQRELEKKSREEKEEQKRKEKEEKEEQRRKEKEEKEEQKRKEKEAREEERKKKQEALELEKQEQELKKKKAAEAFVNFFVPKQKSEKDQAIIGTVNTNMLSSFALKSDMRIAPTVRREFNEENRQNFDSTVEKQDLCKNELYLDSLKSGNGKPMSSGKTWPLTDKDDDDIMIIEDELPPIDCVGEIVTCEPAVREKLRPKLLSFHENRRPPYWGTWRKKSAFVKPRKPFAQDGKQLDYEVDSDEEWEEEEGESIDGSAAGSDDEQEADEYEVDNEVFVPHGYLSDEEATMDEDDVLSLSPETQKARLKYLEDEFESEMKKPTEKLKPRLYGLLWETKEGKPEKCVDALWNYFGKLSMIMNDPTPLLQPSNEPEETEKKKVKKKKVDGEQKSPKSDKKKMKTEEKESKKVKSDNKKIVSETKKNQPGINAFLSKVK